MPPYRRFYRIAGITIQVESDFAVDEHTFDSKFRSFQVDAAAEDTIVVRHHIGIPESRDTDLGREIHRKAPWAVSENGDQWIYRGILPEPEAHRLHQLAIVNRAHTDADIYSPDATAFELGGLESLTLAPTDQIFLSRILAARQACILHSAGLILNGQGLLFVGHSEAGKSTTVKMLQDRAEILCDDRIIVRRWPEGFKIHGTWSHGEIPLVSPNSARLRAILFLKQSPHNRITRITDRRSSIRTLLACLIRPVVTADWWEQMLTLIEAIAKEVPCYEMEFDKSGKVVGLLEALARDEAPK